MIALLVCLPACPCLQLWLCAHVPVQGAEIGATTSVFPFNKRMYDYLVATERPGAARLAEAFKCVGLPACSGWAGASDRARAAWHACKWATALVMWSFACLATLAVPQG